MIDALKLTVNWAENPIVDEPPAVARAVVGKTSDGEEVWVYFKRRFNERLEWDFDELRKDKAIGVAWKNHAGWQTWGDVIWSYHSRKSPRVPPSREKASHETRMQTRRLMVRLWLGGYFKATSLAPGNGWMMKNEQGDTMQRSFLVFQAKNIIPLGKHAVPELLRWIDNENMHIRYITQYALEEITGLEPYFPHFATLEEHRQKGWLEDSRTTWNRWYQENR